MTINLADLSAAQLNFAINYPKPKPDGLNFIFDNFAVAIIKMIRTLKLI